MVRPVLARESGELLFMGLLLRVFYMILINFLRKQQKSLKKIWRYGRKMLIFAPSKQNLG